MSDSLIAFQPAIDEPSNGTPSLRNSSLIVRTWWARCCHLPRGSVKRKSTYLASCSLIRSRTCFVSAIARFRVFKVEGLKKLSRRPRLPPGQPFRGGRGAAARSHKKVSRQGCQVRERTHEPGRPVKSHWLKSHRGRALRCGCGSPRRSSRQRSCHLRSEE